MALRHIGQKTPVLRHDTTDLLQFARHFVSYCFDLFRKVRAGVRIRSRLSTLELERAPGDLTHIDMADLLRTHAANVFSDMRNVTAKFLDVCWIVRTGSPKSLRDISFLIQRDPNAWLWPDVSLRGTTLPAVSRPTTAGLASQTPATLKLAASPLRPADLVPPANTIEFNGCRFAQAG